MQLGIRFSLAVCVLCLAGLAQGAIVADLATDYRGGIDQVADPNGIPGTVSGHWNYFQDYDADPTNGNAGLLPYWNSYAKTGAYVGSEFFYTSYFPWIAAREQWEYLSPAGSLAGHPGPSLFLAVRYLADAPIDGLSIRYRLEKPNHYANDYVAIVKGDGTVLLSDYLAPSNSWMISGTLSGLGTLSPGQSVWLMVGSGGDAAGDQTFLSMTLQTPEPAMWLLAAPLLAALALLRRRR